MWVRALLAAIVLGFLPLPAHAQNKTCPTRTAGDSSNACASTAFVGTAVSGGAATALPSALITQFYIGSGAAGIAAVGSTGTHLSISSSTLGVDATGTGILATKGDITSALVSYCALAGCTMGGELNTVASTTASAGLNCAPGVAPTSPNNGDIWCTSAGIFVQVNGSTVGPLSAGGSSITVGTTTVGSGTNGGVLTNNGGVVGNTAAGTLGQALVSNGTGAQPAYKTGGRTLLNTLTASSSATLSDTTSLTSSYSEYDIIFENLIAATNATSCEIQVQTGGSFVATSYSGGAGVANSTGATQYASTTFIPCNDSTFSSSSAPGISGELHVSNPSGTSAPKVFFGKFGGNASSDTWNTMTVAGWWNGGNGAITGIQMLFSSGNITSGVIKIYGYN